MSNLITIPLDEDTKAELKPGVRPHSYWVCLKSPGSKSTPVYWATTIEIDRNGIVRQVELPPQIDAALDSVEESITGGADEHHVADWSYQSVKALLAHCETLHVELMPNDVSYDSKWHQGQKWLLEQTLHLKTSWEPGGSQVQVLMDKFPHWKPKKGFGRPPGMDEPSFAAWLGTRLGLLKRKELACVDITGTTKKDQGRTLYFAYKKGRALPSQVWHQGHDEWVAPGRNTRELTAWKHCERVAGSYENTGEPWLKCEDKALHLPPQLYKYAARLRIGVTRFAHDTMDMMFITPSGQRKMMTDLVRRRRTDDLEEFPDSWITQVPSRAHTQYKREWLERVNEYERGTATMKLSLPGGFKGVATSVDEQLFDEVGEIDVLVDIRSLCRKGDLLLLAHLIDSPTKTKVILKEDAVESLRQAVSQLKERPFGTLDQPRKYPRGYTGSLDYCLRTGERHTEQCTVSSAPTDIYFDAFMGRTPYATEWMQDEYQQYRTLLAQIEAAADAMGTGIAYSSNFAEDYAEDFDTLLDTMPLF